MADIDNPEVIRFVNETVRPMAEKLRALTYYMQSADQTYQSGIGAILYASGDGAILDGREAEGVSQLRANDVIGILNIAELLVTSLTATGVPATISKPCVRVLELTI
jgi:hypothetical protein